MCMDKYRFLQCRRIEVQSEGPATRRKIKLHLSSSFWCQQWYQITTRVNQHQNRHKLQRKWMLTEITSPLMRTFTFGWTKPLTTFQTRPKVRQGAAFIGGLGYRPRSMVFIVQHVMWTCVCCVIIYFILLLILLRWRALFLQDSKGLKARKPKFCTFVCYIFLCYAYTTILVAVGSIIPEVVYLLKQIKFEFTPDKQWIYV